MGRTTLFLAGGLLWFATGATAGPGDIIYTEDFQDGDPGGWVVAGGDGILGVGEYASGSGEFALTTCCDGLEIHSPVISTAYPGAQLSLRIQRGSASIGSDDPDNNEDLDLYFLTSGGSWQFMARYSGTGTPAQVIHDSFTLTGNLLHAGFRIRLQQRAGNPNADYWHLHDISIIEAGDSGGIGSLCEDFSGGLARWTVNSFGGNAAVTTHTANSSPHSLAIFDGSSRLHSLPLDLSNASAATLNMWVRRGDDSFSEDPDGGEDLAIGFIDATGNLQGLQTLAGSGTPGEVYLLSFALPAAAFHDAFQVRLERYGAGAGGYWHIDDVCVDIERTIDHFALVHDGSGVNCQAEPVQLTAHDIDHFVVENHIGTVTLAASTGNGDWSLLTGNGVLTNAGNGAGNYTFTTGDKGQVLLGLRDTYPETMNIDVAQGSVVEAAGEDSSITFSATGFNFLVDDMVAQIGVQISGKPSDVVPGNATVALQAIRTSDETGSCEAAFQNDEPVELAFTCENPANCSGGSMIVNGTNIAGNNAGALSSYTTLVLDFGDATQDSAAIVFAYENAGLVQLHARKLLSPSGEIMSGASNAFVVRPFGLHLDIDQGSINNRNPAALDPSGGAFEAAGDPFRVSVRAIGWQAGDDANQDGIPDGHDDTDATNNADLSDNLALTNFARDLMPDSVALGNNLIGPAGGNNPVLTGETTITGFTNGIGSSNNLRWQEAGVIEISAALSDGDYLGTGAVHGRSGHVGRFVPHHFTTMVDDHGCSNAAAFTWSKQPLRKLTITAFAEDGSIAENFGYTGGSGFATDVTLSDPSSPSPGSFNSIVSRTTFSAGKAELENTISFGFSVVETAPYELTIRATDTDGGSSEFFAEDQTEIRAGRLALSHAAAPVMVDAHSEIDTHSWNGSTWQIETDDSCTGLVIVTDDFSYSDFLLNLTDGESEASNISFYGGEGMVRFSNPGVGNDGSMRATLDVPEWLEFDWTGDSVPDDPFNTILFVPEYAREAGLIDLHEVVQ